MILLAISGGPDSMSLLYDYKKNKKVVVAHVNYKKRHDSDVDQRIVETFCQAYNIPFEVLVVTKKPVGNFQKWAREIRYEYFQKIYKKYECKKLLTAHHKDDYIETALMQQRSNRLPSYFGIKKRNHLYDMNIYRPFVLSFWKQDLIDFNTNNNLRYATDYTNSEPTYERNKIRLELLEKTVKEKQSIFKWFRSCNSILKKKNAKLDKLFNKWEAKQFPLDFWRTSIYKEELIFKFIHQNNQNIKISKNKIENIKTFLEKDTQSKKYKLSDKFSILKEKGMLKIIAMV